MKQVGVIRRHQLRHMERLNMFYRSTQGNTRSCENRAQEFLALARLQSNLSNLETGDCTNLTLVCQLTWAERFAPSCTAQLRRTQSWIKRDLRASTKRASLRKGEFSQDRRFKTELKEQRREETHAASFLVVPSSLCCCFCLWREKSQQNHQKEEERSKVWTCGAPPPAPAAGSPVAANPLGCSTAEPWVVTDLCPTLHTVPSVSRLLFSPSLLHHLNY